MIFHAERLYSSEEFIYKDRSFVCLAFNSGPMESSGMVLDNRVSGWLPVGRENKVTVHGLHQVDLSRHHRRYSICFLLQLYWASLVQSLFDWRPVRKCCGFWTENIISVSPRVNHKDRILLTEFVPPGKMVCLCPKGNYFLKDAHKVLPIWGFSLKYFSYIWKISRLYPWVNILIISISIFGILLAT